MDMIKKNILYFTILPLFVLFVAASYFRFVVQHSYLVSYEGDCDPYTQSCFVFCEDDECSDPFYFSIIERNAAEVYEKCGPDITDCDFAYECQPEAIDCSISFCDPSLDGENCEFLGQDSQSQE
jgi:hypothetical protein